MKIILSPAKNLTDNSNGTTAGSIPIFEKEANQLIKDLKKLKKVGLQELMGVSMDLAEQNARRFNSWKKASLQPEQAIKAVYAFDGEVYRALNVRTLADNLLPKLDENVRILSGLYGILKPMDLIYPYRLEMGTKFSCKADQKNLYEFWGNKVTTALKKDLKKDEVLINLASSEYYKVLQTNLLSTISIASRSSKCIRSMDINTTIYCPPIKIGFLRGNTHVWISVQNIPSMVCE